MAEEIIKVKVDLDVEVFSKNAKAMSDALSKILGREVEIFNGKINKTAKLVSDTEKALGSAGNAANKAGNAVKQSNQQWTNLALVIQDLPYGFRGIQNNLPALASSVAGFAGPAYLAFSGLVAIITAYDMGLFGAKKTTDEFAKSISELNTNIKSSINYSNSNVATLQSLIRIGTDLNNSEATRKKALTEIKDILGQVNKEEANRITNMGQAILAVNLYTEALRAQQLQEVSGKKIAELQLQLIEKRDLLDKKRRASEREINPLKTFFGDKEVQTLQSEIINTEALIRKLEALNEGAIKANLNNPFANLNKPTTTNAPKLEDNSIALLKSQQQYYKDNIIMFAMYEQEIIRRQADLDVRQAQAEGKKGKYIQNIIKKRDQDILNSAKWLADETLKVQAKLGEEEGKLLQAEADLIAKGRKMINDGLLAINQKFLSDDIDALEMANQVKLKLDKGNKRRQIADYKEYIANLETLRKQAIESGTGVDVSGIDKKIKIAQSAILGLGSTWDEVARKINTSITGLLSSSFEILGESIGNALAGKKFDAISALGSTLANALTEIGKALISFAVMEGIALELFKNPASWPVALAAGVAAVAAGAYLRAKMGGGAGSGSGGGGSVNYGNVNSATAAGAYMPNRPGFGLFGQSPNSTIGNDMSSIANAQNMSANSSTFVLKGQDLLLSVNRAQKASQLKGQNINLAG
jgi:hypothetical protein